MATSPQITFVLATHNRRDVLLDTLRRLHGGGRPRAAFDVTVVDNASTDGTARALRSAFSHVTLLRLRRNRGACARALAMDRALGEYVVSLDDDSYPRPGCIDRMIEHFNADPRLGAANCRVFLPDGREECSAFPNVFIGCGVGFRTAALREVGGLDLGLFMAAEEYDLSFRLINAGWRVQTFDDLQVDHLKTPSARRSARLAYYDTRNNLLIAARYLPRRYVRTYRRDWTRRYAWLAEADGHLWAHRRGVLAGRLLGLRDRRRYAGRQLTPDAFETLFRHEFVAQRMRRLAADGVERVVFADLGKNILAFHQAARAAGLTVPAIGDDRFAVGGRHYRGVPIVPLAEALKRDPDAVVVSNTSPVHARQTQKRLSELTDRPLHCWFAAP